jgi:hypothetical protein
VGSQEACLSARSWEDFDVAAVKTRIERERTEGKMSGENQAYILVNARE